MPEPIDLSKLRQEQAEPQEQPQGPQVGLQLTPQGLALVVVPQPVNVQVGEDVMNQIVEQWLLSHPALQEKLINMSVAVKKTQLALISDIKKSRVN